jgi:sec-independent protein translocase protein TatC
MKYQKQIKKMPLKAHWLELRQRMIFCAVFYTIVLGFCMLYAADIYYLLLKPLTEIMPTGITERKLIFTSPGEAFFSYMRLAFIAALILSFPMISWQVYAFLNPGLYRREKKVFVLYTSAAQMLFSLAALLVYFYIMPIIWQFFLSFERAPSADIALPIILEARVSEYLDMVLSLIFAFGLAFQLPIVLIFLVHMGLLEAEWLAARRRHAIVVIFIVAAILTPPDVLTQITLALPLIILYEISVFICKIISRKRQLHA